MFFFFKSSNANTNSNENNRDKSNDREQQNRSSYFSKNSFWRNNRFSQSTYFAEEKEYNENMKHANVPYYENEYEYSPNEKYGEEYLTLKKNEQSKNKSKKSNQEFYVESTHFMQSGIIKSEITIQCKRCHKKFYSNNKLHKHLKTDCRFQNFSKKNQKKSTQMTNPSVRIIESVNKQKNFHEFVFREHHYVTTKNNLILKNSDHDFCMNNEISMSLIDKEFLANQQPNHTIHKIISVIKIREIRAKIHDNFEYTVMDLYLSDKTKNELITVRLKIELHVINDFKANVLIEMDVMKSKNMIMNFDKKIFTISICQNMKVPLTIKRKSAPINKTVRVVSQMMISTNKIFAISIRVREAKFSKNRNYSFFPKTKRQLNSENEFFAHVTEFDIIAVQIRNISEKFYTISKNLKIGHIRDYDEKKCFMTTSKTSHLAMTSDSIVDIRETLNHKLKTILSNDIIIYGNEPTIEKINVITKKTSGVWCSIFKMINLSFDKWMKINTIETEISKLFRVFKLRSEDRNFVNKKFDALHVQNKLKWTSKSTSYAFPVFVVWHTMHLSGKVPQRKNRVIVNIRNLNKIIEFDAYSMSFQSDIISCVQNCKYILIMNCASFFHQWRIAEKNRHKLIVIIHRKFEQWNVIVMNWKNSPAYVQKKMNDLLKNYSYARTYINDVVIFNNTLNEHLLHLKNIFNLFEKWNIIFKTSKTYFDYFSISLLNQKVDSFELITTKKKLKIIADLSFPKTLKNLEKYFEIIDYLKDYILYYAQKSEALNKRKIELLKNEPMKNSTKKNFNKKIFLENSNDDELKSYNQLQIDFSRINWLTHFDVCRTLYANIDVSKKDFEIMIYHLKSNKSEKIQKSSNKNQNSPKKSKIDEKSSSKKKMKFVLFFFKMLTRAKSRYWPTKLKMAALIWTIRRIVHMIKSSKHSTVIYTNHETNSAIAAEIKLSTTNIDKLNMKLIRASTYLFQFRLEVRHRFEKFNIISNAFSRLSVKTQSRKKNNFEINANDPKSNRIYAYAITLMEMSDRFRKAIIEKYIRDSTWKKIKTMLIELKKRNVKKNEFEKKPAFTNIDFIIKKNLIYCTKKKTHRLCVSVFCEKEIFRLTHDFNNHAGYHRIYQKLITTIFISKLSRKTREYVNHCSTCELNQTKKHATYDELIFIETSTIFFRTIVMNFIVGLSGEIDSILTITCKTSKKVTIIFDKINWTAIEWTNALLDRLFIADWDLSEKIIFDKNFKFVSEFWIAMFKKLKTELLMNIAYHSQTNEQFERINQTIEITLRFFITKNSEIDWVFFLSFIQFSMNNAFNASTELIPSELMYDFKIKNKLTTCFENIGGKFMTYSKFKKKLWWNSPTIQTESSGRCIFQ